MTILNKFRRVKNTKDMVFDLNKFKWNTSNRKAPLKSFNIHRIRNIFKKFFSIEVVEEISKEIRQKWKLGKCKCVGYNWNQTFERKSFIQYCTYSLEQLFKIIILSSYFRKVGKGVPNPWFHEWKPQVDSHHKHRFKNY
jgi:hypothetical protein